MFDILMAQLTNRPQIDRHNETTGIATLQPGPRPDPHLDPTLDVHPIKDLWTIRAHRIARANTQLAAAHHGPSNLEERNAIGENFVILISTDPVPNMPSSKVETETSHTAHNIDDFKFLFLI